MSENNKEVKTNYGNWVPAAVMKMCFAATAVLLAAAVLVLVVFGNYIVTIIVGILFLAVLAYTLYMWRCRNIFDFEKGGLMGEIHEYLVEHLKWNGQGTLLDIGCGAGALTIRCAKKFTKAQLVGMDFWGSAWSYAKAQCERNAKIEQVDHRIYLHRHSFTEIWRNWTYLRN